MECAVSDVFGKTAMEEEGKRLDHYKETGIEKQNSFL